MYESDIQPRKLYGVQHLPLHAPTEPTSTPNPLLHFNNKLLRLELHHEAINVLQLLHGARVLSAGRPFHRPKYVRLCKF